MAALHWRERDFDNVWAKEMCQRAIALDSFNLHIAIVHEAIPTVKKRLPSSFDHHPDPYITGYTRFGFFFSSNPDLNGVVELYDGERGTSEYAYIMQYILDIVVKSEVFSDGRAIVFHEWDRAEARHEVTLAWYESCQKKYNMSIHRILWDHQDCNPGWYIYSDKVIEGQSLEEKLENLLEKAPNKRISPKTVQEVWRKLVNTCTYGVWSEYFRCKNLARNAFFRWYH